MVESWSSALILSTLPPFQPPIHGGLGVEGEERRPNRGKVSPTSMSPWRPKASSLTFPLLFLCFLSFNFFILFPFFPSPPTLPSLCRLAPLLPFPLLTLSPSSKGWKQDFTIFPNSQVPEASKWPFWECPHLGIFGSLLNKSSRIDFLPIAHHCPFLYFPRF